MGAGADQGGAQQPSIDLAGLQRMAQQKQAWEAANPGQNYAVHAMGQMGQNLMGAPSRVADSLSGMAQAPGQALSGLQALAARFGGGQTAPY